MMNTHRIDQWMARPETLDRNSLHELRALTERYPYFQTARLLYLRNLVALRHPDLADELQRAAVFVADRKQLFRLMEEEKSRLTASPQEVPAEAEAPAQVEVSATAEPEEAPAQADRTLTLIDDFLTQMGAHSEDVPEAPQPEMPVDMAAYLVQNMPDAEPAPPMPGQHLIDKFLQEGPPDGKEEPADDVEEEKVENESEEDYFTETLAKIYIKQQRYSKAIEIIKKLNLKYPKKNVYFADQIRFLEKLIINNHSK
jgi:hypothetical protein